MTSVKPQVKQFLKDSEGLLEPKEPISEFLEVLKQENIRQIKSQLAVDLAPLESRLKRIEQQQERIIELLKSQLNLDLYEKQIMDLLKAKMEKE